mmetsp:Transcript_35036/g.36440  ORF Transcript_35036/g.36440 Transcript_35036/m.36440 type:complete len:84 (-) Transcript_35036:3-254(-)
MNLPSNISQQYGVHRSNNSQVIEDNNYSGGMGKQINVKVERHNAPKSQGIGNTGKMSKQTSKNNVSSTKQQGVPKKINKKLNN